MDKELKFKKEDLQNLVYDESTVLTKIRDTQTGNTRWCINYELIFRFEGAYYRTNYRIGATEQQDQRAFEYEPDLIDCVEVWPEVESHVIFTAEDPQYTAEGLARVELLI